MLTGAGKILLESGDRCFVEDLVVGTQVASAFDGEAIEVVDIKKIVIPLVGMDASSELSPIAVPIDVRRAGNAQSGELVVSPEQEFLGIARSIVHGWFLGPGRRNARDLAELGFADWLTGMTEITYFMLVLERQAFVDVGGLHVKLPGFDCLPASWEGLAPFIGQARQRLPRGETNSNLVLAGRRSQGVHADRRISQTVLMNAGNRA